MHQHELPVLGGIAAAIRWVEELVSLLSGPLLSIGLAIALIDLLTGGGLLRAFPELLYAWGVCQAVGIDSQLVATWDRVRMAARRKQGWHVAGYVILGCALGYVGFLSAEAFGLQQAFGLTESDALARLGIDAASWQLQRAALAVFLVALSGFTRYHAPPKQKQTLEDERAALERELTLEPMRQRLRAQQAVGVAALGRQAWSAAFGQKPPDVPLVATENTSTQPPTGPGTPTIAARSDAPLEPAHDSRKQAIANGHVVMLPARVSQRVAPARRRTAPRRVRTVDNWAPDARKAWASGARTVTAMVKATGMPRSAASKHVGILKAENQPQQEREQVAL